MAIPEPAWADQLLPLDTAALADWTRSDCPFLCVPEVSWGRLKVLQETIVRESKEPGKRWPQHPSPGWAKINSRFIVWCAPGAENVLRGIDAPTHVHGEDSPLLHEVAGLDKSDWWPAVMSLLASGKAFAFDGRLFLLPETRFQMNSFGVHVPGKEPLGVFVGYRGHDQLYPDVLAPGVLRRNGAAQTLEDYHAYKRREAYASNIVKEWMWRTHSWALTDLQARGMLQHHRLIASTDLLDLAHDVDVAKWFALNTWNATTRRYEQKRFAITDPSDRSWYDEASIVYQVCVRVIGGSGGEEVPAMRAVGIDADVLMPINVSPVFTTRASRQGGIAIDKIGRSDRDFLGAILNVNEWRFHPVHSPTGWDSIGGATMRIADEQFFAADDSSALQDWLLPTEEPWLEELRARVESGLEQHSL